MYRRKTLTGSPDPTRATGRIKTLHVCFHTFACIKDKILIWSSMNVVILLSDGNGLPINNASDLSTCQVQDGYLLVLCGKLCRKDLR